MRIFIFLYKLRHKLKSLNLIVEFLRLEFGFDLIHYANFNYIINKCLKTLQLSLMTKKASKFIHLFNLGDNELNFFVFETHVRKMIRDLIEPTALRASEDRENVNETRRLLNNVSRRV